MSRKIKSKHVWPCEVRLVMGMGGSNRKLIVTELHGCSLLKMNERHAEVFVNADLILVGNSL